jgi:hypothetical protein
MVTVCAWCQKYMGSKEPLGDPAVTHGICSDCVEREQRGGPPVLVVSRARREEIPSLQALLRGAPSITIVVDRRAHERRDHRFEGRLIDLQADRRAEDRRRLPSLYLV